MSTAEGTVITKELRNMLNVWSEPNVVEVEKGHIQRFIEAVQDPNPLYQDQVYASKSRYGGIIAPPTFLQDAALVNLVLKLMDMVHELPRHLYGGIELEFLKPMRLGDTITARSRLVNLYEKEGKEGKLLFMVIEATYTSQHGELLVRGTHTFICR